MHVAPIVDVLSSADLSVQQVCPVHPSTIPRARHAQTLPASVRAGVPLSTRECTSVCSQMARVLAARAQVLAASTTHPSPFALRAAEVRLRLHSRAAHAIQGGAPQSECLCLAGLSDCFMRRPGRCGSMQAKLRFTGGKMDDITVIVARVVDA
jgi:hypothetical protein